MRYIFAGASMFVSSPISALIVEHFTGYGAILGYGIATCIAFVAGMVFMYGWRA